MFHTHVFYLFLFCLSIDCKICITAHVQDILALILARNVNCIRENKNYDIIIFKYEAVL